MQIKKKHRKEAIIKGKAGKLFLDTKLELKSEYYSAPCTASRHCYCIARLQHYSNWTYQCFSVNAH